MIYTNNYYLLYILHNYFNVSIDTMLDYITYVGEENLVVMVSLGSIFDIKHFEEN
jgi:hypothetical protein